MLLPWLQLVVCQLEEVADSLVVLYKLTNEVRDASIMISEELLAK